MADLMPNDLSHLSDDEFSALCPHDGHAPGPEPLSPQAQAVLNAIYGIKDPMVEDGAVLAAALRAAVAEVRTDRELKRHYAATMSEMLVLDKLLAIATELENQ